jgi:hypothetical protein
MMTNEEKNLMCIIPSNEMRTKWLGVMGPLGPRKMQQKFYNWSGTAMVWRDIPELHADAQSFYAEVNYE